MILYILGVFVTIFVIYVYYIQFYSIKLPCVFNDDVINKLKTGDIILFKAYNNFNSIGIGSYFGHMGIVYIDPNDASQTPMLFEANGVEHMKLKSHHNKKGIFLSPVYDRVKKYKGRVFLKRLNRLLSIYNIQEFTNFIHYALQNMYYNTSIFTDSIKKMTNINKCGNDTNCGQLVYLSLLKLHLLPYEDYDIARISHLSYIINLTQLQDNYCYVPLIEIVEHPFAY